MTEQRRAGVFLAVLALVLAVLGMLLHVLPHTSAAPAGDTFEGSGSTTVSVGAAPGDAGSRGGSDGSDPTDPGASLPASGGDTLTLGDTSPASRPSQPRHEFWISVGSVAGLYPGKRSRLPIVIHNSLKVPISVRSATTTATGPVGCQLDTSLILRTRTFIHRVVVPANGSKAKSLRFGMRKTATDECQNAIFTIYVHASAVRA